MIRETIIALVAAITGGAITAVRYRGLYLATYAIQLSISLVPATLAWWLLVSQLGAEPALGRAVDGDLAAALVALRAVKSAPVAIIAAAAIAATAYVAISWFLTAGLLGVYREQPEGRAAVARVFGAAGARRLVAFVRLFLLVAPLYAALAIWIALAIGGVLDRLPELVTWGDLAGELAGGLIAPALILWLAWTAVDHARVELVADDDLGAWRSLGRGVVRVVRRPACALHTAAGHIAAAALGGIYLASAGLALGIAGLIAARQLFALGRHLIHLAILAGQVELGERLRRGWSKT